MATIVDSFLVTFGIDPSGYAKGSDEIRRQNKKTGEAAAKSDKELQASTKRSVAGLGSLRNELTGLFLTFAGAASLKSFVSGILGGDAATGRLAANLGVATTELGAWQLAAKQAGGTAEDANAAFALLSRGFQMQKLTGDTGFGDDLRGLGVTLEDLNKPGAALLKMAEAGERMDRAQFFTRLSKIGIPPSIISTLARGSAETRKLVDEMERQYAVTKTNADAAAKLEATLELLQTKIKEAVRPALYDGVEGLTAFLNSTTAINSVVPVAIGLLGALAVATIAATWPYLLLAGAIAGVVYGYKALQGQYAQGAANKGPSFRLRAEDGSFRTVGSMNWGGRGPAGGSTQPDFSGGGGVAGGAPADGGDAAYFRRSGLSEEQIKGVQAGIHAEGGGLGMAENGAFGIGQWRGSRRVDLMKRYGQAPTRAEQLEFLVDELKGRTSERGGAAVLAQTTAAGTLEEYIRSFMRPGTKESRGREGKDVEGDLNRGYRYLGMARPGATTAAGRSGGTSSVTIGEITVYTPGTDAAGIARDLPGAISNRMGTANANTGLD